jgi:hypothetical protein
VNHQVVTRADADRQSGPCHGVALMHWAQSWASRKHSRHAITDVGDWDVEELFREVKANSLLTFQDLKTEHDDPSGLKIEFDFR